MPDRPSYVDTTIARADEPFDGVAFAIDPLSRSSGARRFDWRLPLTSPWGKT